MKNFQAKGIKLIFVKNVIVCLLIKELLYKTLLKKLEETGLIFAHHY